MATKPKPIELTITRKQADLLSAAQARLVEAQQGFTTVADVIVAGHSIEGRVRLVNLDTDQDPPVLRVEPA